MKRRIKVIFILAVALSSILFVYFYIPTPPEGKRVRDELNDSNEKLKGLLAPSHGDLLQTIASSHHLQYVVRGDLNLNGVAEYFSKSGLFDTYKTIYIQGSTTSGRPYELILTPSDANKN
jgi:hypothetical protein